MRRRPEKAAVSRSIRRSPSADDYETGTTGLAGRPNYGQRSLVETTMGRYKTLIGPRLRARGLAARQTEAAIGVAVLNRMLAAGRPKSVRCQRVIE
jgi:hypothetical protein